jgi:hypothetical protein
VNFKRPVPLWMFLIGILATASATAGVILLPSVLGPKPDFIMSSLHPMYIQATHSNTTLITIQATRNFTGIVTVIVSSPTGITTSLHDSQTGLAKDQILLGKAGNLSLTVTDQKVGNFAVIIIASSGVISHTQSLPVIAQDLIMTSSPSPLTITRGSSGTAELDLSSVNGLSGNASFATRVYGSSSAYLDSASNASTNPMSIILSSGGIAKIALTINVGRSDSSSLLDVIVYATIKQSWEFRLDVQVNVI